jgi:hypothetical protein
MNNLKMIEKSLLNLKTIEFIKKIIGNTQLSKTELETMIPIEVEEEEEENEDWEDDELDEDEFNEYMDRD